MDSKITASRISYFDLPREIRDKIYELCLPSDSTFEIPLKNPENSRQPDECDDCSSSEDDEDDNHDSIWQDTDASPYSQGLSSSEYSGVLDPGFGGYTTTSSSFTSSKFCRPSSCHSPDPDLDLEVSPRHDSEYFAKQKARFESELKLFQNLCKAALRIQAEVRKLQAERAKTLLCTVSSSEEWAAPLYECCKLERLLIKIKERPGKRHRSAREHELLVRIQDEERTEKLLDNIQTLTTWISRTRPSLDLIYIFPSDPGSPRTPPSATLHSIPGPSPLSTILPTLLPGLFLPPSSDITTLLLQPLHRTPHTDLPKIWTKSHIEKWIHTPENLIHRCQESPFIEAPTSSRHEHERLEGSKEEIIFLEHVQMRRLVKDKPNLERLRRFFHEVS